MFGYGSFPGPYFPVFALNTNICYVNHRIQSEYRKYAPEKIHIQTPFTQYLLTREGF